MARPVTNSDLGGIQTPEVFFISSCYAPIVVTLQLRNISYRISWPPVTLMACPVM